MISVDKFKTMNIISKLKNNGEDVDAYLQEYDQINYFTGKEVDFYFKLFEKLTKSSIKHKEKPVITEIKDPGIHVSGTFEDYLK